MSGHVIAHPALIRARAAAPANTAARRETVRGQVAGLWMATLARMVRSIEERRLLATLDDRMLADIGVSRSEAHREANRAPWDLNLRG